MGVKGENTFINVTPKGDSLNSLEKIKIKITYIVDSGIKIITEKKKETGWDPLTNMWILNLDCPSVPYNVYTIIYILF